MTISALFGSSATTLTCPSTTLGSRSLPVATTADDGRGRRGAGGAPGPLNGSRVGARGARAAPPSPGFPKISVSVGGQLLRLDVLHVVDEDALVGLRVHVELAGQLGRELDVGPPAGHEQRVRPLVGEDQGRPVPGIGGARAGWRRGRRAGARGAGARHRHRGHRGADAPAAEELVQDPRQLHRVGVPDGDQPEIVGRDLHVEHAQDLENPRHVGGGVGDDQEAALDHEVAALDEWPQRRRDPVRRDVLERDDLRDHLVVAPGGIRLGADDGGQRSLASRRSSAGSCRDCPSGWP